MSSQLFEDLLLYAAHAPLGPLRGVTPPPAAGAAGAAGGAAGAAAAAAEGEAPAKDAAPADAAAAGTKRAAEGGGGERSEGGKRLVSLAEGDATDSDHETLMWTVAEPGALHTSPWALENSAESHAVIATVGSGRYHFVARYE